MLGTGKWAAEGRLHCRCMVLLKRLPLLEVLDLSDTLVTNDGLVHLEPLRHIRSVSLSYTGGPQGMLLPARRQ